MGFLLKGGQGGQVSTWRMRNLIIYRGGSAIEGGGILAKLTLAGFLPKLGDPKMNIEAQRSRPSCGESSEELD